MSLEYPEFPEFPHCAHCKCGTVHSVSGLNDDNNKKRNRIEPEFCSSYSTVIRVVTLERTRKRDELPFHTDPHKLGESDIISKNIELSLPFPTMVKLHSTKPSRSLLEFLRQTDHVTRAGLSADHLPIIKLDCFS